jgi:predicted cobalt transporter CbtA
MGWMLATIYLVTSLVLLYRALHCRDDFFCGIIAIPMYIPAGIVYLRLFADHVDSPAALQWQIIVPTLVTNAAFYYLLGNCIGWIAGGRKA